MIEAILQGYAETARLTGRQAPAPAVVDALREVAREDFVLPEDRENAHWNRPLPIGHGQTISQPYIVALMADLVDPTPDTVALEIGTGCGYAAAVLSRCVKHVYSIESVQALADGASDRLARLGYDNVTVRWGDGYAGWPEHAPYDGIVVTAAAPKIPRALVDQLASPGRMAIPIGRPFSEQTLVVVEKNERGKVREERVLPVAFVPMVEGLSGHSFD